MAPSAAPERHRASRSVAICSSLPDQMNAERHHAEFEVHDTSVLMSLTGPNGRILQELAKSARAGNDRDFDELTGVLERMPVDEALPVARAFSHFLTLANIAEQHHRIRRRRFYERDPQAPPQIGSCAETLARLRQAGISADDLHAAVVGL